MAKCEDCIHNDICDMVDYCSTEGCGAFIDSYKIIKLPLKFEQAFYFIDDGRVVADKFLRAEIDLHGCMCIVGHVSEFYVSELGTLWFLSSEEAERSMTRKCKDCIHSEVCMRYAMLQNNTLGQTLAETLERVAGDSTCEHYRDRTKFVELPDIGDVVSLDEAIDASYAIATSTDECISAECKAEHMRLCGWLGELKHKVEKGESLK